MKFACLVITAFGISAGHAKPLMDINRANKGQERVMTIAGKRLEPKVDMEEGRYAVTNMISDAVDRYAALISDAEDRNDALTSDAKDRNDALVSNAKDRNDSLVSNAKDRNDALISDAADRNDYLISDAEDRNDAV